MGYAAQHGGPFAGGSPGQASGGHGGAAIRLVLAGGHRLVREGLAAHLEGTGQFDVVELACDGRRLLAVARAVHPDVILMDFSLPEADPDSIIREILAVSPNTGVVVLDTVGRGSHMRRAMAAGALGYISRGAPVRELERALKYANAKQQHIELAFLDELKRSPPAHDVLTPRQLQVLSMVAQGKSNKEIAFDVGLSPKTVDIHRQRLMQRLNISSVAGVTIYALREGLIQV